MSAEQRVNLHVLAFLFFRMGRMESAGRIYAALVTFAQPSDWRACVGLAAVALEQEDGESALAHILTALEACTMEIDAPERAIMRRMHAKALWLCGNKDKAREIADISSLSVTEKGRSHESV